MKKADYIKILMDDYGYEKEDLKFDAEGKPYTNGKLKALIEQEEKDAKEVEEDATRFVAKEAKFSDSDLIVVMNGLGGSLTHRSGATGKSWRFKHFGQTDKMPYGELLSLRNGSPHVFEKCWIVIMNKEVQEEFGLTEKYKNILTPQNIEKIFEKNVNELEEFIKNLPEGMKTAFISKARELYASRKLYDIRIVEFIEKEFGFSLEDNAPLSNIV